MQRILLVGATTAIGEELARQLADAGAELCLISADRHELEDLDHRLCQSEVHRFEVVAQAQQDDCQRICESLPQGNVWTGLVFAETAREAREVWLSAFGKAARGTQEEPTPAVLVSPRGDDLTAAEVLRARRRGLALNAVLAPPSVFQVTAPRPTTPTASEVSAAARTLLGPISRTLSGHCLSLGGPLSGATDAATIVPATR